MIAPEEWLRIPLEARLTEQASHTDDDLLRGDLLSAVKKLDEQARKLAEAAAEITRLERLATQVTPY